MGANRKQNAFVLPAFAVFSTSSKSTFSPISPTPVIHQCWGSYFDQQWRFIGISLKKKPWMKLFSEQPISGIGWYSNWWHGAECGSVRCSNCAQRISMRASWWSATPKAAKNTSVSLFPKGLPRDCVNMPDRPARHRMIGYFPFLTRLQELQ